MHTHLHLFHEAYVQKKYLEGDPVTDSSLPSPWPSLPQTLPSAANQHCHGCDWNLHRVMRSTMVQSLPLTTKISYNGCESAAAIKKLTIHAHSPQVPSCWLCSESKYRAWGWFSCREIHTQFPERDW